MAEAEETLTQLDESDRARICSALVNLSMTAICDHCDELDGDLRDLCQAECERQSRLDRVPDLDVSPEADVVPPAMLARWWSARDKVAPAVAGVIARTDASRGVWKAPAGLDATLNGVPRLSVSLTDQETGELNPLGINCLRVRPATGPVIWGARTRQGDDRLDSEWRYISVRRLALYIEESLYRGTQWAVFEPNDESLWAQLRLNTGAFMQTLFRQGAFQGQTPQEAYLVKVDKETTTHTDIDRGIVNMIVGFAPLKPAEFVIIKIQQLAGPRKE
jgi:hypothetical protein